MPELPNRLAGIDVACDLEIEKPTDQYIQAFAQAVKAELQEGELGTHIEEAFDFRELYRPPMEGPHALNFLLRAFQRQLLKKYPSTYPQEFDTSTSWSNGINDILADHDAVDGLDEDLHVREVQSNVAERYKAFKLIALAYRQRLGEMPRVLDIGCSLNLGLKKLARNDKYPFSDIDVIDQNGRENESIRRAVAGMLGARLSIGASMGVDLFTPENAKHWVRSCSFYPSELLQPSLLMEFDDLTAEDVEEVGFYFGDFADEDKMSGLDMAMFAMMQKIIQKRSTAPGSEIIINTFPTKFDMVTFATVMYMLTEEERCAMIERARYYVKDSGLIVIQDFADKDDAKPSGLNFHEDFKYDSFPYRTYAIDPNDPELEPQQLFAWENGRCKRLQIKTGRIAIGKSAKSFNKLIRDV